MEPEIGSVRELSLPELTDAVRRSLKEWEDGKLPSVPNPQPEAQPTPQAEAVPSATVERAVQAEVTPPTAEPVVTAVTEAPAAKPAQAETSSPVASESATPEPARQEAVVEAVGAVPVADDAAAGED